MSDNSYAIRPTAENPEIDEIPNDTAARPRVVPHTTGDAARQLRRRRRGAMPEKNHD